MNVIGLRKVKQLTMSLGRFSSSLRASALFQQNESDEPSLNEECTTLDWKRDERRSDIRRASDTAPVALDSSGCWRLDRW